VVPDEIETPAFFSHSAPDDVLLRTIVVKEIKNCRGKALQPLSLIPDVAYSFQENFRQDDGGANINVNPATLQPLQERAKNKKIGQ